MPLKFAPATIAVNGGGSGGTSLAVMYTLRCENALVLRAYSSTGRRNGNGCNAGPHMRLSRSLLCLRKATSEWSAVHTVSLQLPQLVFGPSVETGECGIPTPAAEPFDSLELDPLCLCAERMPFPLLLLLPPHNEFPLLPQRRHSRVCSAGHLAQALAGNKGCRTWSEMLVAFNGAWASAVLQATADPQTPISPNGFRLTVERQELAYPPGGSRVTAPVDVVAPFTFNFAVVGCRQQQRRLRGCVSLLRPQLESIDVASFWSFPRQALPGHDGALQHRFHVVTHPPDVATAAQDLLPLGQMALPEALFNEDVETQECLEVLSVVIPRIRDARTQRAPPSRVWHFDDKKTVWGLPSMPLKLDPTMRFTELRFPDGREMRQTLTLRNAAGDRIGEVCDTRKHRRPYHHYFRRRRHHTERLSGGEFSVVGRPDFWKTFFLATTARLSADCLLKYSIWQETKRKMGCDLQQLPPLLPLLQQKHSDAFTVLSSPPSHWRPLAVELGDGGCGSDYISNIFSSCEGPTLFPIRVFSREVELQGFQIMREWRLKRKAETVSPGSDDSEDWYHSAFLHDVLTMAHPYCSSAAVVEDAELHYCYRLAFHREMQRSALHALY